MKPTPIEALLLAALLRDASLLPRAPAALREALEKAFPLLPEKGEALEAMFEDVCKRYCLRELEVKLAFITREVQVAPVGSLAEGRGHELARARAELLQEKQRLLSGGA